MRFVPAFEATSERDDYKRADDDRKDRVRSEDGEIDRTDNAFASKLGWSETKIVGSERMMKHIRNQKKRRDPTRGEHTKAVLSNPPPHNKIKTRQQKNAAQSVQECI